MKQKIQEDLKAAMREGDQVKTGTLRMLLASVINKEKEKGETELSEGQVQHIIATEVKKRKEAAKAFETGDKADMAEQEKKEMQVLQAYLPEQMGEEEVRKLVKEAIAKTGAVSPQDMGKVMAALMPDTRGKADGALVSSVVKELLSS